MSSKQMVVLGMHRSGTSVLTQVLRTMGCYAGLASALLPPNHQNPTGFWERIDANAIDRDILHLGGATWCFVSNFSPSRLSGDDRARIDKRIKAVVNELATHRVSVIKEPRMCLLFDFWRRHFPDPICVFIVRRPTEVAASLRRRDGFPAQVGIALWEAYTRSALQSSEGLPRCLIWHDALLDRPGETIRVLHQWLRAECVEGLRVPTEEELRDVIRPDLRSRVSLESDTVEFLNEAQLELYRYLRQGDLSRPVYGTLSLGARETLRCFQDGYIERLHAASREQEIRSTNKETLDILRDASTALFDSIRWRIGQGMFSVVDRLAGAAGAPQPADVIRDTLRSDNGADLPPPLSVDPAQSVPFVGRNSRRVIAIMFTHNEERFVEGAIRHLKSHGVEVYLCDNGSTDATFEIAESYLGDGVTRIDRVPRGRYFDLRANLLRVEELSGILGADWIMRVDPDERHLPPDGGTLAEAFARVEEQGYNAVNFAECVFIPVQEHPDHDYPEFDSTMKWYYPFEPRHPHLMRAWKRPSGPVELVWSGGHAVRFPGLNLFPHPFLMKHYQFLSVAHAVEKYVRREFQPESVERGWHEWRVGLRPEDIRLPPQDMLRPWPEDGNPDVSDPWTKHWLALEVERRKTEQPLRA